MKLHKLFQEALAIFEALRRLGFPAEEIYIRVFRLDLKHVQMVLRHKEIEFSIDLRTPHTFTAEEIQYGWTQAGEYWNSDNMTNTQRSKMYRSFFTENDLIALTMALFNKGIQSPKVQAMQEAKDVHARH